MPCFPGAFNRAFNSPEALFSMALMGHHTTREHGTIETPQMEQDFSIIPVKTRKEEYLRRYSFFFEKFPVEKYVPFDLSPEQPVFP